MDQVSIIVNTRVPEVTAMFNMPYYTNRIGETQSLTSASGTNYSLSATNISGYTLDADGNIDFPVLGKINLAGKTREEAANYVKDLIIASKQTKEAVVTVEFMNLGFSVLGEVTRPGRYKIDRDRFTIFDALGLAGDLTINGQRENVTLVRHNGQADEVFKLNLLDAGQLYSSPAFYVQQGDMIYVLPNEKRVRESTVNGNTVRSSSFWISLASLTTSVIVLMSNLSSHSSSK
jgi:polysaccharide export outer membrane protein